MSHQLAIFRASVVMEWLRREGVVFELFGSDLLRVRWPPGFCPSDELECSLNSQSKYIKYCLRIEVGQ